MKVKNSILLLVFFFSLQAKAQLDDYTYQRTIATPTDLWHQINLPLEVYKTMKNDLSDIKIYGISNQHDTIEVPYLIRRYEEKIVRKSVAFKVFNTSSNESGFFFTFEVPVAGSVNQIILNFSNQNYDWPVKLQGSHDLNEWFTLVEDYRILSIHNPATNFTFSTLNFPEARFQYFRVMLPAKDTPNLQSASLFHNTIEHGKLIEYASEFSVSENKPERKTTIEIDLKARLPVNTVRLKMSDTFDFYRPYAIQYLSDSFKTERGWQYSYSTLVTGVLNSLEHAPIQFKSTLAEKLKIVIENQDNQPLTLDSVFVSGAEHAVIARFTEKAEYLLVYGNMNSHSPNYDITRFSEKIPEELKVLDVGNANEMIFAGPFDEPSNPNRIWLWLILIVIATALGWFSIKMLRKAN